LLLMELSIVSELTNKKLAVKARWLKVQNFIPFTELSLMMELLEHQLLIPVLILQSWRLNNGPR